MKIFKILTLLFIILIKVSLANAIDLDVYKKKRLEFIEITKQAIPKMAELLSILKEINCRQSLLAFKNKLIKGFKSFIKAIKKPMLIIKNLPTTRKKLDFLIWFSTLNPRYKRLAMYINKNYTRIRALPKCSKLLSLIATKSGVYRF